MHFLNVSKPSVWCLTYNENFTNLENSLSTLILTIVRSVLKGNSKHLLEDLTNAESRQKLKGPAHFAEMFCISDFASRTILFAVKKAI